MAIAWPGLPLEPLEVALPKEAHGQDTVFYLEDLNDGLVYTVQGNRTSERHPPFSSFKIPNFVIALETETVSSLDDPIPYSTEIRPSQSWWPADWAQDQTLESAFRRSAAWAFQDLAVKIGEQRYAGYLKHFGYGNEMHSGDGFWLDHSLQLSCKEQTDFLRRLLTEQFEVSPLALEKLRQVALQSENDGYALYGKTGAGPVKSGDFTGPFEGWFVGWLERPGTRPVVFALWTRGASFEAIKDYRLATSRMLLKKLNYLP